MESTLQQPAVVAAKTSPKAKTIVYWIVTALFCLQMSFTAYAQLRLPQVAQMFTHLGFPAYFRVELSWAKLVGVALLLAPSPARLKEWATPVSPSPSFQRSSRTSHWAMPRRCGVGPREPASCGRFRMS